MKTEVGVGMIGSGFARRTQIPGFQALREAKVVSIASRSGRNARATAEEFGIPHHTDDWRELVRNPAVDLVCVTTPPRLHLEMTLAALENGKHVLCEKPMAMNTVEASRMRDAANASGLLALIDHQLRFVNGRQKAFEMIRSGAIGRIRHVRYMFRNAVRGDHNLPWTWWSDLDQGGGALGAIVSHIVDSIRWLLDTEVEDVFCNLHTHVRARPYNGQQREVTSDDEALLVMKLSGDDLLDNATGAVTVSMVEGGPYRNRFDLFGTAGALRIEDGGELFTGDLKGSDWKSLEFELGNVAKGMEVGGWSRGFTVFAAKIVEAILNGNKIFAHAPTFEDGVAIQAVLDAARESNRTRSVVGVEF